MSIGLLAPAVTVLRRKCACRGEHGGQDDCVECRKKRALQRKAAVPSGPLAVPTIVRDVLQSPGQALDHSIRAFMEPRFGHDFSQVRVHTDGAAAESARAVNSAAYTVGQDVVFDRGHYAPATAEGKHLLAHELVHVIQQGPGSPEPLHEAARISQPGDSDEREAESVAERVTCAVPTVSTSEPRSAGVRRGSRGLQRRVRHFECSAAEHHSVEAILGRSVLPGDLRSAADAASRLPAVWIGVAASELRVSPRSAATIARFHEAFGANPDWVPPWRPAAARWVDFGDLITTRVASAASIVDEGSIRYFCWGSPAHCPECTDPPATYFACSSFLGAYLICLGRVFWQAWQSGDMATMGSTLLHEALHIYFNRTVSDGGRSGNANCYERFVVATNGVFMHPATAANCPPAP